ncbi:MAG: hypothetical protein ACK5N7_12060, partial [Curvibacter sp.]
EAAEWLDASLDAMVAMTEDDRAEPTLSPFGDDTPPSVSLARLNAFGGATCAARRGDPCGVYPVALGTRQRKLGLAHRAPRCYRLFQT